MVNTGRPSRACFNCKERKVKCDQQMPSCGRCMRLLGHCPGYPDRWLLTLRRQDAHAAQLVNTRVERSRSRRAEQAGLIDMPVVRTLDFSAETMSVHKFFADYTAQSGVAFLELLADKYTLPSMPCLSAALEATAMASSSRQLRQSGLMTRTRQAYSKAISGIRHAMQDESLIKEDSVLLSLFVLGLFQTVAAEFAPQQNPTTEPGCHPHARGALALFQYRAKHQLVNSLDRGLLALFWEIRLMDFFTTPREIPPLWFELDLFIDSLEDGPNLDPLIRRAVDFKVLFLSLDLGLSVPEIGRIHGIQFPELIRSGLSLAQSLDEEARRIVYVDGVGVPSVAFNGFIAISCATNAAIARCLYLTVRLHVLEILSEAADALHFHSSPSRPHAAVCTEQLLREITSALNAAPSRTEGQVSKEPGIGFRAYSLYWPMTAVLRSKLANEATRAWVREKLLEIGTAGGFGLAVTAGEKMER
ncbi:hypothetical protein BGZ61DRAFT_431832 [Ilyonectria robusta]|uniref:uncharacterized protein n=1 Tax=Ilyonectria robusta TaxID=1079257 RepID=UPI001E8E0872|nr:uncharacterized protein BGZ61DRAFT_431832 [Ilyonectria robusta]KAH8663865.1 hypothetical protein BGZ61DRAFT_431832 [Ilyonectria robusta]